MNIHDLIKEQSIFNTEYNNAFKEFLHDTNAYYVINSKFGQINCLREPRIVKNGAPGLLELIHSEEVVSFICRLLIFEKNNLNSSNDILTALENGADLLFNVSQPNNINLSFDTYMSQFNPVKKYTKPLNGLLQILLEGLVSCDSIKYDAAIIFDLFTELEKLFGYNNKISRLFYIIFEGFDPLIWNKIKHIHLMMVKDALNILNNETTISGLDNRIYNDLLAKCKLGSLISQNQTIDVFASIRAGEIFMNVMSDAIKNDSKELFMFYRNRAAQLFIIDRIHNPIGVSNHLNHLLWIAVSFEDQLKLLDDLFKLQETLVGMGMNIVSYPEEVISYSLNVYSMHVSHNNLQFI